MNRSLLKSVLLSAVVAVVFGTAVSSASAADICVGTSTPLCPAQSVAGTASGLSSAFTMAQDGSHPGNDRIIIAAGTYSIGTQISYSAGTGQGLTVLGQGDTTIIKPANTGMTPLYIQFLGGSVDSISGIKFMPYSGTDTGYPYGLSIRNGAASNLTFVNGPSANDANEMTMQGGSITNSTFTLPQNGVALTLASNATASNLTISGDPTKLQTNAIHAFGGTSYTISNTTIRDVQIGVASDQGTTAISDSLIDLGSSNSGFGVWAHNTNNGGYPYGLDASNLTIVGTGATQYGIRNEAAFAVTSNVNIKNSIFRLTGSGANELYCTDSTPSAPGNSVMNLSYSLINTAAISRDSNCTGSITTGVINRTAVAEPFVDPAARNYALSGTATAIDAGDPATVVAAGRTDLSGKSRLVAYLNPCAARIDMGAYEAQSAGTCVPPPSPPKLSIKFGKVVGKFKIKKPAKAFSVSTKKPKSRVPITASVKTKVKLTLKLGKKSVKGSQSLTVPAGTSYLTFSGKFNHKTLKPGKYTLYVTASGLKDAQKSTLNVVR